MRIVPVAVMLVLAVAAVGAAQPPDGERLYRQNCARCHEGDLPVLFSSGPIREYPAGRIYEALSAGLMAGQATGLSTEDKRAVAEYVSGSAPGTLAAPIDQIPPTAYCSSGAPAADPYVGPSWNGWSPDRGNARFQSADAAGLGANSVPDLALKWAFGFPGVTVASLQATIVGGRALVGSGVGVVYALDADTGCLQWAHETDAGVRSTIIVGPGPGGRATAFFGDLTGNAYAVDFETGERRWKVEVDDHRHARITGAPALYDGRLYVPVASLEEVAAEAPTYQCCTFRGSVAALDATTGRQLWQHYPIDEEPTRTGLNPAGVAQWGPSGVGIWASPTLDPDRNRIYVATGDSYSNPVSPL
ncbi:MAG TPA: cytochrome C oxidase Cbb3, partial [Acidobacteria bacterium]|nr:cytochrome C oxidase Cbb3 [Acidobacteriota bacterium]